MKTETQDIDMLARAILTEVREEADQIKAEAREKAEAIRRRAQEQAEAERRAILERGREDAERLRGQAVATAQLKARSLQLTDREKLMERVFKTVRERLPEVQERPDYEEIAAQLLREALVQLRVNKAQVRADKTTAHLLKRGVLRELSKELNGNFENADDIDERIGVIVDAADGRLHYDNTLETRLQRLEGTLRASVYKILTGERS